MNIKAPAVDVRQLGIQDYHACWQAMKNFTRDRTDFTRDEIWLLQHYPVFTQGQAGKAEHILDAHGMEVVQSDRGGQVTYHGPGQLVVYFLLDVRRRGFGVRTLVDIIEQSIIEVLASYGVTGELKKGAPGVYVGGNKIAALGLRIRKGCSMHGLSFNIDMDLAPFTYINPCGFAGLQVCQLADFADIRGEALLAQASERLLGVLLPRLL